MFDVGKYSRIFDDVQLQESFSKRKERWLGLCELARRLEPSPTHQRRDQQDPAATNIDTKEMKKNLLLHFSLLDQESPKKNKKMIKGEKKGFEKRS